MHLKEVMKIKYLIYLLEVWHWNSCKLLLKLWRTW